MNNELLSERLVEADFLWQAINVGDCVVVECDLEEEGVRLITQGEPYRVVAKERSARGRQMLEVETDLPGRTLSIFPALICNYICQPDPKGAADTG